MLHFARLRSSEGLNIIMYSIQIDSLSNAKPAQQPVPAKSNYFFIGNFLSWGTSGEIGFEALCNRSKCWRITRCIDSLPLRFIADMNVTLCLVRTYQGKPERPESGRALRKVG